MADAALNQDFGALLRAEIARQGTVVKGRDCAAQEVIFAQGDPGDGIYLIESGAVRISTLMGHSNSHALCEFGPGDFFGEMAIINDAPRSANAQALEPTRLMFVAKEQVKALMGASPALVLGLLQSFSRRMRDTNSHFVRELIETERLSLMGRFARSIVHDLKNPLSVIALGADAAASARASEELRQQARKRIHQQVQRLTHMLNELLRVSEGATQHALQPQEWRAYMAELVEQVSDELAVKQVELVLCNEPPELVLPLNVRRLDHVFFNLFNNASDFMPKGGRIEVRFIQRERELEVEVRDSGPGFKPGIVQKLFTPFFTDGKPTGTGLGLSICKNIVEDHGGRIWAREEAGMGGIFCFTLPLPA